MQPAILIQNHDIIIYFICFAVILAWALCFGGCRLLMLADSKLKLAIITHCWHSRGVEESQTRHCINLTSFGFSWKKSFTTSSKVLFFKLCYNPFIHWQYKAICVNCFTFLHIECLRCQALLVHKRNPISTRVLYRKVKKKKKTLSCSSCS